MGFHGDFMAIIVGIYPTTELWYSWKHTEWVSSNMACWVSSPHEKMIHVKSPIIQGRHNGITHGSPMVARHDSRY